MDDATRSRLVTRAFERCRTGEWAAKRALATELAVEHGAAGYLAFVAGSEQAEDARIAELGVARDETTRDRDGWFDLHAPPPGCAWSAKRGARPADVVAEVWTPVASECPRLVETLQRLTKAVLVKVDAERPAGWRSHRLAYLLERPGADPVHALVLGGPPMRRPKLSRRARAAGWRLPADLRRLYAVHAGLGECGGRGVTDVLSPKSMKPLPRRERELLELCCDEVGNRVCWQKGARGEPTLVDWDHETRQRSKLGSLWQWLDGPFATRLEALPPSF